MALRKTPDPKPHIAQVTPPAAIAGGEFQIKGKGFARTDRPRVLIGEVGAPVIIGSDSFVIARVPEGATAGDTRRITEWLREHHSDVTCEVHHGGQPLYPYFLSIE